MFVGLVPSHASGVCSHVRGAAQALIHLYSGSHLVAKGPSVTCLANTSPILYVIGSLTCGKTVFDLLVLGRKIMAPSFTATDLTPLAEQHWRETLTCRCR